MIGKIVTLRTETGIIRAPLLTSDRGLRVGDVEFGEHEMEIMELGGACPEIRVTRTIVFRVPTMEGALWVRDCNHTISIGAYGFLRSEVKELTRVLLSCLCKKNIDGAYRYIV